MRGGGVQAVECKIMTLMVMDIVDFEIYMDADSRTLGRVENACEALKEGLNRVLDDQQIARREVLEATSALNQKLDRHAVADDQSFTLIRDGIGGLRDRIARLEPIVDTIDNHGATLLEIEQRLSTSEEERRTHEELMKNNRRWQKGLIGAAGVAAGASGTASVPHFWKWLSSLFH